mgnify:CR=1 FL=1
MNITNIIILLSLYLITILDKYDTLKYIFIFPQTSIFLRNKYFNLEGYY